MSTKTLTNYKVVAKIHAHDLSEPEHIERRARIGELEKRKKAVPRLVREQQSYERKSKQNTINQYLTQSEGSDQRKWRVSLHKDLMNTERSKPVPDKIVQHYLKKETQALVLYRPPEQIVGDIFNKAQFQSSDSRPGIKGSHKVATETTSGPTDDMEMS